ncbi:MAG: hypothetical protein IH939_10965 [Acidobacteria bacterium]|nr:hypothetical protein [Acidobacteriota bacterium]
MLSLTPVRPCDGGRLACFEREAKVRASLDHTEVGGIYGQAASDGVTDL